MKIYIKEKVKAIFNTSNDIKVEVPPKDNMGDYSLQCSSLINEEYKNPIEIANKIKEEFNDDSNYFTKIVVMGPYVNFYLDYNIFSSNLIKKIEGNKNYGSLNQGNNKSLLIEHTSINPNAEPHIGRCRNSLIGDFMSNLYDFTGYNVEKHYFINDLGKKIALLVIGVEKYGLESTKFSDILDIYVKISSDGKSDEELDTLAFEYLEKVENGDVAMIEKFKNITDKCVEGQMEIFNKLNINFDVFSHESDYIYNDTINEVLEKIKEKGKLKEDENGRLYVDLSDYDIPTKEPVLVLTRSNKTSLYPLKDLAYTVYKMKLNNENNFIVLGEDQTVYMKQIESVLDIMGYGAPKLINYSYVLLNGDKMSTSGGTVVLITDFISAVQKTLLEEFNKREAIIEDDKLLKLTNACIKFTMLNVSKSKIVNFNLESATSFNGESGMYILYSIVRINSLLKKCEFKSSSEIKYINDIEHKIIKELSYFEEVINTLLTSNESSNLTKYIFNITQKFSKFYEQVNIANEEDDVLRDSRIRLLNSTKQVLVTSLNILGIESIESL